MHRYHNSYVLLMFTNFVDDFVVISVDLKHLDPDPQSELWIHANLESDITTAQLTSFSSCLRSIGITLEVKKEEACTDDDPCHDGPKEELEEENVKEEEEEEPDDIGCPTSRWGCLHIVRVGEAALFCIFTLLRLQLVKMLVTAPAPAPVPYPTICSVNPDVEMRWLIGSAQDFWGRVTGFE